MPGNLVQHPSQTKLDECRALWGEPEQAVCQGLQLRMRSSYTHVPFRTSCHSCRGVEVGLVFSERVMADMQGFIQDFEMGRENRMVAG